MPVGVSQTLASEEEVPGYLNSLSKILELHRNQYDSVSTKIGRNPRLVANLENLKEIQLDPYFVRSIAFHSNPTYLRLINDECTFYSLLESDLLKSTKGKINNVMVTFLTKKDKKESALITKNDFINYIYKKKCFNNKEISILFSEKNLKKTIRDVTYPVPTKKEECKVVIDQWRKNSYTPYLCGIPEKIIESRKALSMKSNIAENNFRMIRVLDEVIKNGKIIKRNVPFFQRSYLENLCSNLDNPKRFCDVYMSKDIWNKIVSGEEDASLIRYKCRNILNKKKISKREIKACATSFNKNPKICLEYGNKGHSSLFPMNDCATISAALSNSNLITEYHDCPGKVDNESIVNLHRILSHINPPESSSSKETCANETMLSFVNLQYDFNNERGWPLKICYRDRLKGEDDCKAFIPGKNKGSKLSEEKVVQDILPRVMNVPEGLKCEMASNKQFNPARLKYKTGCYILYNREFCTMSTCARKIIVNLKEVKGLSYQGVPSFEYFPNSFSNEKFAISNILTEMKSLNKRSIRNFTDLRVFLDQNLENIIHGVGCIEDLLPNFYQRNALNQCRPLPFIIDGYVEKDSGTKLIIRTSIDDIHSPRLIPWGFVFNGVGNYRVLHPLQTWTLFGLRNEKKN
ncbi:MAG: hypothetical protein HN509_12505 [Halobacteriovoraceae bacterium]|nr:hypothetical protein [Halobacteriovoraceae bacterium]